MKIPFALLLATVGLVRAGEIENYYWKQPATNHTDGGEPFSGPKPPAQTHGITEIGIECTPCFGSCPVYTFVIRSDGAARYHGVADVDKIGTWEAAIDTYQFHHLANFIVQAGYPQMADTFTYSVTDGDTVYTTFVLNGRRKVFRNYASSGPSKLWALQRLVDGLAAGAVWHPAKEAPATNGVSPNQAVQRTGASRSSQETNRAPTAAGSRR